MKSKRSVFFLLVMLLCVVFLPACSSDMSKDSSFSEELSHYKVILSGNEDPHDLKILKERLDDHAGKGKYTMEEKDGIITICFDQSVCQDITVENFVGRWLCARSAYYIGRGKLQSFLGMINSETDLFALRELSTSDIESMELVTLKESDGEVEATTEELPVIDLIDGMEPTYLDIRLTPEAKEDMEKLRKQYDDLILCRSNRYTSLEFEKDVLRIDCSDNTNRYQEYLLYSLSHDSLNRPFSYEIFYDQDDWEEGYYHFTFAPKNQYIPYRNEREKTLEIFKERLDELGMDYDMTQNEDAIIHLKIKGAINEGMMHALCSSPTVLYDKKKKSVITLSSMAIETNLEQGKIKVNFEKYYNELFVGDICLRLGNYPVAQTIIVDKPNGSTEFSQMCFSSGDYNSFTSENPYARFLNKILTGDQLPYEMNLLSFADENGKSQGEIFELPLSDYTNREELMREIRKKYPEASFRISYTDNLFTVKLHLDPEKLNMEDLAADLAAYTEFMDAKDVMPMNIYPCDLQGDEVFKVSIEYSGYYADQIPPKGGVYLRCYNGRMNALQDDFYRAARKEKVFAEAQKYDTFYVEAKMGE